MDALVERLVANPHDEEALAVAHQAGHADPKGYAMLLEKVGGFTSDPSYAAHWLSEAANVWLVTLGDAHRAARVLMAAVDKDPAQRLAADRLAQLYRDKGDVRALAALLERRAKALTPFANDQPELVGELATLHEELGRIWNEPPLSQPRKALESFRRAVELDPRSTFALFHAREILKALGSWDETFPLYDAELKLEQDPTRKVALLRDEAASRRAAGDLPGVTRALTRARQIDGEDPGLQQEFAASILERIQAGDKVADQERILASELLVALAEQFDGEHGLAYAGAGLDVEPGHDRALQLFVYYARSLRRDEGLGQRFAKYLESNPHGTMAGEARQALASNYEATGQLGKAVELLEPLRAAGDATAATKIDELVARGAPHRAPGTTVPSARPPGPGGAPAGRGPMQGGTVLMPGVAAPGGMMGMATQQEMRPPFQGTSSVPPAISRSGPPEGTATTDVVETTGTIVDVDARPLRAAMSADALQGLLDAAQMLAGKGKKADAFAKYREVLDADPAHPEALAWAEDYLRSKRDYAQLRDVLVASVRVLSQQRDSIETRKERLREIAGLCDGNLRDIDGAISAWRQLITLDRGDDSARQSLTRLLERTQRWGDLAMLLEQEATAAVDIDTKITLEKKLANLCEQKLRDFVAAAEAWARIARLVPDDDRALVTAAKLFEKGSRLDLAAQTIADGVPSIEDVVARSQLNERLGELREQLNDMAGAGDAFAAAAAAQESVKLWEAAEKCFVASERWTEAGDAATQRALLGGDPKQQSMHYARAAEHLTRSGDELAALERLEHAVNLDPTAEETANGLATRFAAVGAWQELIGLLTKRSQFIADKSKRVSLRREAATLAETKLGDKEAARELWLRLLDDGDDREALEKLVQFAVERGDHTEGATLLRRVGAIAVDKADKARVALREAELLAEGVGDVDTAIARYEAILSDLDPTCRPALQAIADLQEARENLVAAADALERELKLVADSLERGTIAGRLARLYEASDDPRSAIRALDVVRKADPDDFEALARLCNLCERMEQWDRVAELLAEQVEIEGDEDEAAQLTTKLAHILADRLDRGDEALAALTELADHGNTSIRTVYMELGDKLGWKGLVASKLVEWWFDARNSPERIAALRDAFERFEAVGRDQDATRVAMEIVRAKAADPALVRHLEELAVKTGDADALSVAHELLSREQTGPARAEELVRQGEVMVRAGISRRDAIQHGEAGLGTLPLNEVEPLLLRLGALAEKAADVVDLYERQVSRARQPQDRIRALARAAQVAGARGLVDRARSFFELALTSTPAGGLDETLGLLEQAATEGDRENGSDRLRRALCGSFAQGGGGARDGGRTRAMLLRRAAEIGQRDLHDVDQAFNWLGDALIAHVEPETLDLVEQLGVERGMARRSEEIISRALSEVFDGPLVRQLLARRATIRRKHLGDLAGAAADLRKLHDLSPHDQNVLDDLYLLLRDLGDFRGMVQLYEDQILRGKDLTTRTDLARKVARMWEEQLGDAREAADAWRRVLRMKQGDPEATEGLDRAKANALKKPDPDGDPDVYAPPRISQPVPPVGGPPPSRRPGAIGTGEVPTTRRSVPPMSAAPGSITRTGGSMPPPLPASVPPAIPASQRPPPPSEEGRGRVFDTVPPSARTDELSMKGDEPAVFSSRGPETEESTLNTTTSMSYPPLGGTEAAPPSHESLDDLDFDEDDGEDIVVSDDLAESLEDEAEGKTKTGSDEPPTAANR
jgi:tetratricopeptide (TPR) repeat protein